MAAFNVKVRVLEPEPASPVTVGVLATPPMVKSPGIAVTIVTVSLIESAMVVDDVVAAEETTGATPSVKTEALRSAFWVNAPVCVKASAASTLPAVGTSPVPNVVPKVTDRLVPAVVQVESFMTKEDKTVPENGAALIVISQFAAVSVGSGIVFVTSKQNRTWLVATVFTSTSARELAYASWLCNDITLVSKSAIINNERFALKFIKSFYL